MSTAAEINTAEGGISNDGNLHVTQAEKLQERWLVNCVRLRGKIVLGTYLSFLMKLVDWMNWREGPVYDWSPEIQGIILSSLNHASFLVPIPTGYLAGIFGAKHVIGPGLFISSVLTLFIPLAADTVVTLLIVIRIIQGIAQVMVTTGCYSIWVKWAPPRERNQLISIATSGIILRPFIVFAVGGFLCQMIGWPYIFYIFGGIGCVCCLLWLPLAYDDPMNHPFISTDEKTYIMSSLAQQDRSPGWSLPIKAMTKSVSLWVILISYICESWPFHIMTTYTPTYINSVLQVNLRDSGILSALPFITSFLFLILGGLLANFLFSGKILSLITIRKLFTAIVLLPSMLMVSLYWVRSSTSTSVTFLILFPIISSLNKHFGFLKGLASIFSQIAGALSPTTAGFFLSQDSELGWRNVFLLSAAIDVLGLVFYLIFGQAEVQDWAKEQTITHF